MTDRDSELIRCAQSGRELRYQGAPPSPQLAERMLEIPTGLLLDARERNPALAALDLEDALERLTHEWVDRDGELVHLELHQAEPGAPTVVIAPGLGDHARRLTPLAAALVERGFNALGVDRRGHGLSEGGRGDASLEEDFAVLRLAIAEARRRFGGPVALLGDSLGGIMTWYLLTAEPGVDTAVCHDVSHPDESHDSSMRYKAPLMRALGRLLPGAPVPVRRIADYEHVALDPVTRAYFDDEIDKLFNFTITARAAASYLAFEPETPWERVQIPVLVVVGAEDRMVSPAFTERCLARAKPPATTYLEVPGAGHQLFLDDLGLVLEPLVEWMRVALAARPAAAA